MNKKVLILMATYNGESYLKEQLDSILTQTYDNWELWIQDDGSQDRTIDIIENYQKVENRIFLLRNQTAYHGAFLNFFTLISRVRESTEADYYCFVDQDDVWEVNKLEVLTEYLQEKERQQGVDTPIMCYSDMSLIDGNGVKIADSLNREVNNELKNAYQIFYMHNYIWGCATILNHSLFNNVPIYDLSQQVTVSHDNYFAKYAICFGKLYFVDEQLVRYRRHGNNVSGLPTRRIALSQIKEGYSELAKRHAYIYSQTLLFTEQFKSKSDKSAVDLKGIELSLRKGGVKGCLYMKKHNISHQSLAKKVALYLVVLLKSYKKYLSV